MDLNEEQKVKILTQQREETKNKEETRFTIGSGHRAIIYSLASYAALGRYAYGRLSAHTSRLRQFRSAPRHPCQRELSVSAVKRSWQSPSSVTNLSSCCNTEAPSIEEED
jgi:hypothetical protein